MKKTIYLAVAGLVMAASQALAATYTFNNGSGVDANGFANSLGQIYRGGTAPGAALGGTAGGISAGAGVVGVGFFTTEDSALASLSGTQLVAAFSQFGGTTAFSQGGPAGTRGIFSLAQPASTVAGSTFEGKNVYLLVGNGTTFANSTEFIVLKNTKAFLAADDAVPTGVSVTFNRQNSTVLVGAVVGDVRTGNSDGTATEGWASVPEPSAALLGLLGAIGLIRRRR